jgi:hypothetical protein
MANNQIAKTMIVDAKTGEVIEREMTEEEILAHQVEATERKNALENSETETQ